MWRRLRRGTTPQKLQDGANGDQTATINLYPPNGGYEFPGRGFGRPGKYHIPRTTKHLHIFSIPRNDSPAIISHLLTLAGDIESNPGPNTTYTCPTCSKPITSSRQTKGSVLCNSCKSWTHFTCTTLVNKRHYTNTWTCTSCPPIPPIPTPSPSPPPTTPYPLPASLPPPPSPSPPPTSPSPPPIPSPPPSQPPSPPVTPTPPSPPPRPRAPATNTHRAHNINILQLNIDGINTKKQELTHFMTQHDTHIAILQEMKLRKTQQTPTFPNYTTLRQDRADGNGGGLITLVHKHINFTNTSAQTKSLLPPLDNTTETQSIKVRTGNTSHITIVNTYIPPQTSPTTPADYSPQLQHITDTPNLILGGDFNAKTSPPPHHGRWSKP